MPRRDWPKNWLTVDQERAVRAAIRRGCTFDQAAAYAGVARRRLETRLADQFADLRVGQGRRGTEKKTGDWNIDADEIARRTAEIRAGWTEERELEARTNFTAPLPEA